MSLPSPTTRVAVIGGGFSGLMTVINLARLSPRPHHVTLINQDRPMGRGVAFSTRRSEHLLNVAARNMSAFPDLPDHFLQWLRTRSEFDAVPDVELRERFIPRMIYGDYLLSIMQHHLHGAAGLAPMRVERLNAEAVDVEEAGQTARIHLADGNCIEAEKIVLACGNETPAAIPGSDLLNGHTAWMGNPWFAIDQRLPAHGGTIILLGTGLTTVDAVITLRSLGWQGVIRAISRHGWLPQSHFRGIEYPDFPPADVDLADLGLERLIALLELHCAKLTAMGANPAIIVDKMRPHTQRIWQKFTVEERTTFARKYAARWNVMRHRIAPEIHAQITSAQITGQLRVHAGEIERVEAAGHQVRVILEGNLPICGDLVINATGPPTRLSATRSVLMQNLMRRGLIAPDEMDMGVRVDSDHTAITKEGERSPLFLALGPLLRGTFWESIAVPELRGQARRVAETLLGLEQSVARTAEEAQVMMEYMI